MFSLGACFFLLPINFVLAFSLGLTAEVDVGGKLIGLSTVSLLGPSLVAPSIAGRLYERYGFPSNLCVGVLSMVTGVGLYCCLLQLARQRSPVAYATRAITTRSDGPKSDVPDVTIVTAGQQGR